MKNTFADLHNHLIARIEALGDEDLSDEDLEKELKRSRATATVALRAIQNGRLMLDAQQQAYDMGVLESDDDARNPLLLSKPRGNGE